jgi:Zn-dependent peptidase ImmA (M78 family)
MWDDIAREDVFALVDRAIEELLDDAGIAHPPVDAIVLAQRHLGMLVCLDRKQPQRGRAQRASGRKQIIIRPEPTEERHQWTVAHEIGEHLKAPLLAKLGMNPEATRPMAGESLANLFANRLLVPTCWLADEARTNNYDLPALKQRFRTASHEVIAWRLLDLPEPCIITIVDNEHISRRRGNALRAGRAFAPVERRCQEYVHYYSRAHVEQEKGWTVHGWPVHQADWKREILRTTVEEDESYRPGQNQTTDDTDQHG